VCEDLKYSFSSACSFVCAIDHRYISYLLFLRWNLPVDILSAFNVTSIANPGNAFISNIVAQADHILQANRYAQWDRYAEHSRVESDLFAFDPEGLDKSIQGIFKEVDGLIAAIFI
jgi:hypothetical protein